MAGACEDGDALVQPHGVAPQMRAQILGAYRAAELQAQAQAQAVGSGLQAWDCFLRPRGKCRSRAQQCSHRTRRAEVGSCRRAVASGQRACSVLPAWRLAGWLYWRACVDDAVAVVVMPSGRLAWPGRRGCWARW